MRVSYRGLDLGLLQRTVDLSVEPVKDGSDTDLLYHRWRVDLRTVMSPAGLTLASRTGQTLPGLQGDRLGVSLANLSEFLNTPRGQIILTMGDDQVVKCPEDDPQTKQPYVCDPSGTGPTPHARVIEIYGDKTAVLQFTCVFHTQAAHSNVVLSNRWSMRSAIARDGRTVRTVRGVAVVRPDLMRAKGFNIDQFRQSFPVQTPERFIRVGGDVVVNEDESELSYVYMDEERGLQIGAEGQDCQAVDVRGNYTAGVETPIRSLKDALTFLGDVHGGVSSFDPLGGGLLGGPFFHFPSLTKWIPTAKANGLFQVRGTPNSDRRKMAQLAINVALDRFDPLAIGSTLFLVSAYLTAGVGVSEQEIVEFRAEFLPISPNALLALLNVGQVPGMLNLKQEMLTHNTNIVKTGPNPGFQASNGTRGTYAGALLSQILHLPGTLPGIPPGSVQKADLNLQ